MCSPQKELTGYFFEGNMQKRMCTLTFAYTDTICLQPFSETEPVKMQLNEHYSSTKQKSTIVKHQLTSINPEHPRKFALYTLCSEHTHTKLKCLCYIVNVK